MSLSKGNELLQDLYEHLKGWWYKEGKYKSERFTTEDVKKYIDKIKEEYENDTDFKEYN